MSMKPMTIGFGMIAKLLFRTSVSAISGSLMLAVPPRYNVGCTGVMVVYKAGRCSRQWDLVPGDPMNEDEECTLTPEAARQRGENLASRNNDLEQSLLDMQAYQKKLIKEVVLHELARCVVDQMKTLTEEAKVLREKVTLKRNLEVVKGRVKSLGWR
ncbi:hypothetical protein GIB67_039833 [Kingdonia uniflora]|uniref:Uncharacterized protein n=1 Tax=Kingdonia uniflora TaxID=39325 RepID=A0A7J7P3Q1_9MAGN|nr:hypothetical protein GIB67_039833 [Kingdonia uniflora]